MKLTKNQSGVYVASFRTVEGKTKQISTRVKDADEARRVVKESGIEDLERAARAGRLTREAIGHITTGRKLTMAKAIAAWVEWMGHVGKAPKTISNNVTAVQSWVRDMKLETTPPSSITEKHISDWVNAKGGAKYLTRVLLLSGVRSFFSLCCSRGWSIGNPSMAVVVRRDTLDHKQLEPEVREPFNMQEIHRILKDCEERNDFFWRFAVAAASELGLRLGAICQLEWDAFGKVGVVIVTKNKRNKRLELPISPELADVITTIPMMSAKYLFPEQRATILDQARRATLSTQFKRLCERLGIKGKSFHCLRHSVATSKFAKADKAALAKKLVDNLSLEEIAALLGHSSIKTTKGYVH
jgi:integrase